MIVYESRISFQLCAIGCAFAGMVGRPMTVMEEGRFIAAGGVRNSSDMAKAIARHLGQSENVFAWINNQHLQGVPALTIRRPTGGRGTMTYRCPTCGHKMKVLGDRCWCPKCKI